jgi:hypothetical protein
MKPFITPELTSVGKKEFAFQLEGVERQDLLSRLMGEYLVAYALPQGHTMRAAWELSLVFDSGLVLDFSSASTVAFDWQEVGSLNLALTYRPRELGVVRRSKDGESTVPPIVIAASEVLIYEDDDVVVECGIALLGSDGSEVIVAAGIPPGSVSVQAPFSAGQSFEPQFPLDACRRQGLY